MYLSLNIFQYFPHSLTKLNDFYIIDVQTRRLQMSLSAKSKGAMQKTQEKDK
jgi:hypothetical protein